MEQWLQLATQDKEYRFYRISSKESLDKYITTAAVVEILLTHYTYFKCPVFKKNLRCKQMRNYYSYIGKQTDYIWNSVKSVSE